MKVRIGIDVGGTFTDAAVINNETYELVGSSKVPTTHNSTLGVAEGIIQVLNIFFKFTYRSVFVRVATRSADVDIGEDLSPK